MIKLLLSFMFGSAVAFSVSPVLAAPVSACEAVEWRDGEVKYAVCFDGAADAYVSQECVTNTKCGARELITKARALAKTDAPRETQAASREPSEAKLLVHEGPALCAKFGGHVVDLKLENAKAPSTESAFCVSEDQTLVDLNSLSEVNRTPANAQTN